MQMSQTSAMKQHRLCRTAFASEVPWREIQHAKQVKQVKLLVLPPFMFQSDAQLAVLLVYGKDVQLRCTAHPEHACAPAKCCSIPRTAHCTPGRATRYQQQHCICVSSRCLDWTYCSLFFPSNHPAPLAAAFAPQSSDVAS
jgi:hypothetical protein